MFEDVKKEDEKIVTGDPRQVEDVFDSVDPAPELKSAVQEGKLRPVMPVSQGMAQPGQAGVVPPVPPAPPAAAGSRLGPPNPLTNLAQVDQWSKKKSGRGMKIALIVLGVIVLAGGGYAAMTMLSVQPVATQNTNIVPAQNTNQPSENTNVNSNPSNALIDSDGDGLTDVEETALGTDPAKIDSDGDGLSDKDEVRTYKTNPLAADSDADGLNDKDEVIVWQTDPNNPDTDGDGYKDGEEVQNGYDPKAPGKKLAPVQP